MDKLLLFIIRNSIPPIVFLCVPYSHIFNISTLIIQVFTNIYLIELGIFS